MADDQYALRQFEVEVDQTVWDIVLVDDAGQPVDLRRLTYEIDRATGAFLGWRLEPPAAPSSEEPAPTS